MCAYFLTEVAPDTSSLVVEISAAQTALQEGQRLSLSCTVDTQNQEKRFLSVAWLRGNVELARIGPTGVLSVGPDYSGRETEGELRAVRTGDRDYGLTLQPVRTEDQGEYICRAWPQDRSQDGAFTQGTPRDSSPQLISISATGQSILPDTYTYSRFNFPSFCVFYYLLKQNNDICLLPCLITESGLSVEMQPFGMVMEGARLKLTCKVTEVEGQLSVTWQHKSTSTTATPFTNVISLSQEGVTEIGGSFTSRKVRATRPAADTFTLELDEVTLSDSGVYQCAVSEWKTNSKTNSQSQAATVEVTPLGKMCLHLYV